MNPSAGINVRIIVRKSFSRPGQRLLRKQLWASRGLELLQNKLCQKIMKLGVEFTLPGVTDNYKKIFNSQILFLIANFEPKVQL